MLLRNLELSEHKQKVARVYNLAAAGYDRPALRFFPIVAERLVELACIRDGENVLDAGTGTGMAAFAAAYAGMRVRGRSALIDEIFRITPSPRSAMPRPKT